MIYKKISNCLVTNKHPANIVYPFIDTKDNEWYNKYGGYHSGVDIDCKTVYTLCACVVLFIGDAEDGTKSVTIQYDKSKSFTYKNLIEVFVKAGQPVPVGRKLGEVKDNCHFEYLSVDKSEWPVRVLSNTYYKHDPEPFIDGSFHFDNREGPQTIPGSAIIIPEGLDQTEGEKLYGKGHR